MTSNVPSATKAFSSTLLLNALNATTALLVITFLGLVRDTQTLCAHLAMPPLAVLAKLDTLLISMVNA